MDAYNAWARRKKSSHRGRGAHEVIDTDSSCVVPGAFTARFWPVRSVYQRVLAGEARINTGIRIYGVGLAQTRFPSTLAFAAVQMVMSPWLNRL
jgi:hypothetical protein